MEGAERGRKLFSGWVRGGMLIILFSLVFSPGARAAVTGKIAGVVVDAETGEPLPGANVLIEGTALGAATNTDGYFFIIRISPDVYNVQARMMGYESITQEGVEVTTDHTTQLRFRLNPTVIEGKGVVVKAEAEVIKMDLASSAISAKSDDIEAVPFVSDVGDYINRQAGIKNWMVRGGSVDEVGFVADGLNLVDGRTNNPALMPPLSIIKELNVIKGGFAPEYGNLRSGLINIVTRDPSDVYSGTLNFRFSPAHLKHRGSSVYDPDHYWLRAYLSETDSLCWIGRAIFSGKADAAYAHGDSALGNYYMDIFNHNEDFSGWLAEAGGDADSAVMLREQFMWTHRARGAQELVDSINGLALVDTAFRAYNGPPREGKYGDKADWSVDAGFGGPVPVIGEFLGDLGFYVSYNQDREAFPIPTNRDFYIEETSMLKLVTHPSQSIKVSFSMMYGEQNTMAASYNGELDSKLAPYALNVAPGDFGAQLVDFIQGTGYASGAGGIYLASGDDAFKSELTAKNAAYYPAFIAQYDIFNNMQGLTFDHQISENTFYTVRISHLSKEVDCRAFNAFEPRDTATKYILPSGIEEDETPYGYYGVGTPSDNDPQLGDDVFMGAYCAGAYDTSESHTWDFKVDLTNQLNSYNEIKVGFEYNYADMSTYYEKNRWDATSENWVVDWDANPIRGGAYIQDKIEFEGIIATVGLRADWNDPNCDWFELGTYDSYFTSGGEHLLLTDAPTHRAEGHFKIAPRFGISHPVSENAKLYFNYGDFYSLPASYNMYQIFWGTDATGVRYLGDPEIDWCRARAYELGTDWNIYDMFRVHLAGYYKDVTNELEAVEYVGSSGFINYKVPDNLRYEDIRGIDFRISKDFGDWVRGYINYDYKVKNYGPAGGKQTHYQEPLDEVSAGAWDTLERELRAQPLLEANIQFITPQDLGSLLGNISLSLNYTWEAGTYETFDPLDRKLDDPTRPYLNVQWKPWRNMQARLQKGLSFAGMNLSVFAEVDNLFDWKYLDPIGFESEVDKNNYKWSLKLPMYREEEYEDEGDAGDDQFGDYSSEGKPYINDPELTHLAFHHPRYFVFGLRVDF